MRFLWKSQLKKERGKFVPKGASEQKKPSRKERLTAGETSSVSRYAGVVALWLLFLGTSVYVGLFSPYMTLHAPEISGLHTINAETFQERVDQELAQKYLGFLARNRFLLVRPEKLSSVLQDEFPLIRTIDVTRTFPNVLAISVSERESILLWCSGDTCSHIREDGSVRSVTAAYEREENRARTIFLRDESGRPLLSDEAGFGEEFARFPVSVKKELQGRFSIETEDEMRLVSRFADELRVKTNAGWQIYFGTRIPLETSLEALRLLFEKELPEGRRGDLEYIDLRTENRVFYRYKEGSEGDRKSVV